MYVVLLLAAIAVLAGVVVIAMGRGGEIVAFRRDLPDFRFRLRSPLDAASLRLPLALLGYQELATRDALLSVAQMLADRDAEIARLRAELAAAAQFAADQAGSPADAGAGKAAEAGEPAPRS